MRGLRDRFEQFMMGRNGSDTICRVCLFAALGLLIVSLFVRPASLVLTLIALGLLIYNFFRMFSRNVTKRWAEVQAFTGFFGRISGFFKNLSRQSKDTAHRYFRCPNCSQTVRVPKGKGRISITCPKCRTEFIKKT